MIPKILTRTAAGRSSPPPAAVSVSPAGPRPSESSRDEWPGPSQVTRRLNAIEEFLRPYELDPRVCNPKLLKLSPDEKEYLIRLECVRISLAFKRKWERKRLSPARAVKEIEKELRAEKLSIARRQGFLGDPDRLLSEKQVGDSTRLLRAAEQNRKNLEVKLQAAQNFNQSLLRVDPKTGEQIKNHNYARYFFPLPKEFLLLSCQRLLAVFGRPHQGRTLLHFALAVIALVQPAGKSAGFSQTELERSWRGLRSMQQYLDQPSIVRRWKTVDGEECLARPRLWRCVLGPSFLTDLDVLPPW